MFEAQPLARIFSCMLELKKAGTPVDAVTVVSRLGDGYAAVIRECACIAPRIGTFPQYAAIVLGRVAGAHAGDGAAKPCHSGQHGRRDDGGAGADGGAAAEHYAEGAQRVGADLRRGRGTGIPGPSEAGHIAENRLEALQRRAGRAAARVPVHHCRAARRRQNGFCPASGRAACQALPAWITEAWK